MFLFIYLVICAFSCAFYCDSGDYNVCGYFNFDYSIYEEDYYDYVDSFINYFDLDNYRCYYDYGSGTFRLGTDPNGIDYNSLLNEPSIIETTDTAIDNTNDTNDSFID